MINILILLTFIFFFIYFNSRISKGNLHSILFFSLFKLLINSTIMTTISEIVVVSSNSNKRKRRSTGEEKEIENQRPPAKRVYSPAADDEYTYEEESSQSVNILIKSDGTLQQNQNALGNNNNNNSNNSNNNINSNGTLNGATIIVTSATASTIEMSPQSLKKSDLWASCMKCCTSQTSDFRRCPLPMLSWADAKEVWRFMCKKDEKAALDRDSKMLENHPGLQPRMRAILLDWLIEVCEVYKLHRETYYLALDYLDRYLATKVSISKTCLQLIGITCLFIAAKVEEIYPPKLSEFAYVTDGACNEEDILKQELVILTSLKWQITPVTIIGWLSIYMQLNVNKSIPKTTNLPLNNSSAKLKTDASSNLASEKCNSTDCDDEVKAEAADDAFVFPQFSGLEYAQTAQLIDLCTLDVGIANFSYSVIAAAAISHTFNR